MAEFTAKTAGGPGRSATRNLPERGAAKLCKRLAASVGIVAMLTAPAFAEHAGHYQGSRHHGGHHHAMRPGHRAVAPLCGFYCGGFFTSFGAPAGSVGPTVGGAGYSAGYSGWVPGSTSGAPLGLSGPNVGYGGGVSLYGGGLGR